MNNCIMKEGERRPPERIIQYNKCNTLTCGTGLIPLKVKADL